MTHLKKLSRAVFHSWQLKKSKQTNQQTTKKKPLSFATFLPKQDGRVYTHLSLSKVFVILNGSVSTTLFIKYNKKKEKKHATV